MLDESEFISTILQKVGMIIDTNGLSRTVLIFEIIQMLNVLLEKAKKKEEDTKKEKE